MMSPVALLLIESLLFAVIILCGLPLLSRLIKRPPSGRKFWVAVFLVLWLGLFVADYIGTSAQASSFIGLFVFTKFYFAALLLLYFSERALALIGCFMRSR